MKQQKKSEPSPFAAAARALARRDAKLRAIIRQVGPCTLRPFKDTFAVLARTIISQQLSTRAAITIGGRLVALLPAGLKPGAIDQLNDQQIRGCGISGGKLKSLRDLCAHFQDGRLSPKALRQLDDEDLRERLLAVHGIGPWSVDMVLIFGLGRLDVLPVGDLGLRLGVKEIYGLKEAPSPAQLVDLAESWRPYRTIATWYFWRSRGFVPQS